MAKIKTTTIKSKPTMPAPTVAPKTAFTPKAIMAEISQRKKELAEDSSSLVDGSLSSPGPFDNGKETIASATKPSQGVAVQQFLFMCALMLRPKRVLDVGTGVGVSSAYLAAAQKCLAVDGTVDTVDASPYRTRIAKRFHDELGLDNVRYTTGLARNVLLKVLEQTGPVDLALIDADHDLKAFTWFYETLIKAAAPGALLIFTGIEGRNEGVATAWKRMRNDARCYSSATFGGLGLIYKR